jgi:hypothetical protein
MVDYICTVALYFGVASDTGATFYSTVDMKGRIIKRPVISIQVFMTTAAICSRMIVLRRISVALGAIAGTRVTPSGNSVPECGSAGE